MSTVNPNSLESMQAYGIIKDEWEEPQHCQRCACYSPNDEICDRCAAELDAEADHDA